MPATVTLRTTTLTYQIDPFDHELRLASGTGVYSGYRLWIDRELMDVMSNPDANNIVRVKRGVDGTASARHSSLSTVTIGQADQFYSLDPVGAPPSSINVSPWINVLNGKVWLSQGDPSPDGQTVRWWQEVTNTYPTASLGIIQAPVTAPTVST